MLPRIRVAFVRSSTGTVQGLVSPLGMAPPKVLATSALVPRLTCHPAMVPRLEIPRMSARVSRLAKIQGSMASDQAQMQGLWVRLAGKAVAVENMARAQGLTEAQLQDRLARYATVSTRTSRLARRSWLDRTSLSLLSQVTNATGAAME